VISDSGVALALTTTRETVSRVDVNVREFDESRPFVSHEKEFDGKTANEAIGPNERVPNRKCMQVQMFTNSF
jgi:hypothetical protein